MKPQKQEELLAGHLEQQRNEGLANCEQEFCRLCNVTNFGPLEIFLHRISSHHLNNWKARIRLQSKCIACSVSLRDIKSADAHVQGSLHKQRMMYAFQRSPFPGLEYNCPPCGIAFHCSIALELHLGMTHKAIFSNENSPELINVIQQLSGFSPEASKANIDLKCLVCQTDRETMDGFIMHLFSTAHVCCLRASICLVCDKSFIHISDRELHLLGTKHRIREKRSSLSNNLRKARATEQKQRTGYVCMYCMVWCRSWPCFILHLEDKSHRHYAGKQDQQLMHQVECSTLKASSRKAIGDAPCPSISVRNWKTWLDQPGGLSAWCNVCMEAFSSPEATEKHLEDHQGVQTMEARKKAHPPNYEGQDYNCFECKDCSVIFKSPLGLTVHKASSQHHVQQHRMSGGGISVHRTQHKTAGQTIMSNLKPAEVVDVQQSMADVEYQMAKASKSEARQESLYKNCSPDEFHGARHREHEFSDSLNKERGVPFEEAEKGKTNSQYLGAVCVNSCSGDRSLPVSEGFEAGGTAPRDVNNSGTAEPQLQNNDGPDCHGLTGSSIRLGSKEMAPVVIAAALPSSGPIQDSLQSAMKLVTESLFAALPKIRKHSTEIHSGRKRPKLEMCNGPANKNEDGNLGAILKASVFEGLQSLDSCFTSSKVHVAVERPEDHPKQDQKSSSGMENSSDTPPMSISMNNEQGIAVVLAVTAIPQASGTEAPSPT